MSFDRLATEGRNPATEDLDVLPAIDIVRLIQQEDETVAASVRSALPQIAEAVEWIADGFRNGGRLIYVGAGTSGRLGILDAVECPPTFGTSPEMVVGLIAGGPSAVFQAVEGAEDDPVRGAEELSAQNLRPDDVVVGVAASGRTPYVMGALRYASEKGIATVAVVCVPDSAMAKVARLTIAVPVGPEVISGSTRMKAGTAQKMVLNMLSTAAMVKFGKTFGNLMVDVRATNEKLQARARRIVRQATGVGAEEADVALTKADGSVKAAIVTLLTGVSVPEAYRLLHAADGSVRGALERMLR